VYALFFSGWSIGHLLPVLQHTVVKKSRLFLAN